MPEKPLRLGMLGMWHSHAAGIARQVAAHPDEFTLVGGWDSDPAAAAARRREWGPLLPDLRLFGTEAALLAEPLDGVVVEGRVYENLRLARLALESGRPVMLEKPAGTDRAEHRRLVDLAQRKHLHVQMIYLFRYMSAVEEMVRRARSGSLGQVYEFRARLPKDLPSYRRYEEELEPYPGGIFFEMAGHVIDMLVAVMGPPETVTPFLAHHHTVPGSFVDNGVAVFGGRGGWGIIEVPALEVAPHARRVEVYGTRGACAIPHLGSGHLANKNIQPLDVYETDAAAWKQLELPAAVLQIRDLREFAAVTRGRKAPDYSLEHDLTVQDALLRASRMG